VTAVHLSSRCSSTPTSSIFIYTLSLHDALPIYLLAHGPKSVESLIPKIARKTSFVISFTLYDHSNMAIYWPKNHLLTPRKTRIRSEEHTSELQSHLNIVCRLLLEKQIKHTTSTF